MKKREVVIGQSYVCKVSDKLQTVSIVRESRFGGWDGVNIATGREIRVRTAARLRYPVDHDRRAIDALHVGKDSMEAEAISRREVIAAVDEEERLFPGVDVDDCPEA
jgi:hypothetical protein